MQISFGRGELCENFFASIPFFVYSESTVWTGSEVENEVLRERERQERLQKYKKKSGM